MGSAADDARITMLVNGMCKHLTRQPIPEDDIRKSLEWMKSLVDSVLCEDTFSVPPVPSIEFVD